MGADDRTADEDGTDRGEGNGEHRPDHEILDPKGPCMACGAPNARIFASPEGPARLCPTCATLEGLGCP